MIQITWNTCDGIIGFSAYATWWKVGTVKDILFDETTGKFRYLLVDLGLDFCKKSYYQFFPVILMMNAFMLRVWPKNKQKIAWVQWWPEDWLWLEDRVKVSTTPATDTLVSSTCSDPGTTITSLNPALGVFHQVLFLNRPYIAEDRDLQLPERTRVVWN